MTEDLIRDEAKCELRILGQRHVAVDVQALCDQLDLMVGPKVAEVIMNQHQFRLGKEDVAVIRRQRPQAIVPEIIDSLRDSTCASGAGIAKISPLGNPVGTVDLEISHPCVKRAVGAASKFFSSYWCGALTSLFDKTFKAENLVYDEARDLLRCRIVPR